MNKHLSGEDGICKEMSLKRNSYEGKRSLASGREIMKIIKSSEIKKEIIKFTILYLLFTFVILSTHKKSFLSAC